LIAQNKGTIDEAVGINTKFGKLHYSTFSQCTQVKDHTGT